MKNGFTLIELLAVVVLLGILLMFLVPSMTNVSSNTKIKLYNSKVKKIEAAAKEWGYDNLDSISANFKKTVVSLIEEGYISGDKDNKTQIENPINGEMMNSCNIGITYNPENNKVTAKLDTTNNKCKGA